MKVSSKLLSFLAVATLGLSGATQAAPGFYVGADYLKSNFPEIPFASQEVSAGYAVQFGYQFPSNGNWYNAVDIEYINAGTADYKFDGLVTGSGSLELTGVSLNYKPKYYIGAFYLGAQLGFASLSAEGKVEYEAMGKKVTQDVANQFGTGMTYGLELGYEFGKHAALKGGYRIIDADVDSLYLGIGYTF